MEPNKKTKIWTEADAMDLDSLIWPMCVLNDTCEYDDECMDVPAPLMKIETQKWILPILKPAFILYKRAVFHHEPLPWRLAMSMALLLKTHGYDKESAAICEEYRRRGCDPASLSDVWTSVITDWHMRDNPFTIRELQSQAEAGNPGAMSVLGMLYLENEEDANLYFHKAIEMLDKATKAGDALGMYLRGLILCRLNDHTSIEYRDGLELMRRARMVSDEDPVFRAFADSMGSDDLGLVNDRLNLMAHDFMPVGDECDRRGSDRDVWVFDIGSGLWKYNDSDGRSDPLWDTPFLGDQSYDYWNELCTQKCLTKNCPDILPENTIGDDTFMEYDATSPYFIDECKNLSEPWFRVTIALVDGTRFIHDYRKDYEARSVAQNIHPGDVRIQVTLKDEGDPQLHILMSSKISYVSATEIHSGRFYDRYTPVMSGERP